MSFFLGIDTSCYTSSIAVADENETVLLNIKQPLVVEYGQRGLRQDMVNRFITEINDVRNYKTKIITTDKGIDIDVSMAVLPGTNIPLLTANLQSGIKDNIETLSGIAVGNINILITDTSLTGK